MPRFEVVERAGAQSHFVARFDVGHHALPLHRTPEVGRAVQRRVDVVARLQRLVVLRFPKSTGEVAFVHRQPLGAGFLRLGCLALLFGLACFFDFAHQHRPVARDEPVHRNAEPLAQGFQKVILRHHRPRQIAADAGFARLHDVGKLRVLALGKTVYQKL